MLGTEERLVRRVRYPLASVNKLRYGKARDEGL